MFAGTQRRHFSFYLTLPLIAAIVSLLVAKLIAWQRADIIAELADRVAHRDSREAVAALRQLAAMPRPPAAVLVAAAASTDREVAEEGRRCIGRLLRRAERRIEAERRVKAVARQLAELAESLSAQQSRFARGDLAWLENATEELLLLANRLPARHTPLIAVHCDAILRAIQPNVPSARIVDAEPVPDEPFVGEAAKVGDMQQLRQVRLDREDAAAAAGAVGEPSAIGEDRGDNPRTAESAFELMNSPWRASWSHPLLRIVPSEPPDASPADTAPVPPPSPPAQETPPADTHLTEPPLANVGSRELLRRWLARDESDAVPLEQELSHRGFERLSKPLVQQLFSPASEARFRLVDAVLTEPGVNARPWLMLLSEDADADVRLSAVTIMATSNDAALVEKAWQVSVRDRDPRIAGLAERLRARRAGVLRR